MKREKTTPLYVPVLWFMTTGIWTITLYVGLYNSEFIPSTLTILHCLCVMSSLAAAIANYRRYKKSKDRGEQAE